MADTDGEQDEQVSQKGTIPCRSQRKIIPVQKQSIIGGVSHASHTLDESFIFDRENSENQTMKPIHS